MFNKVFLIGHLASDPEVRASPSGTYVTRVRIATNTYAGKAEDGTAREHTEFHSLVLFGKPAETAGTLLHKGQLLFVEGELRTSSWEDPASAQKKYRTDVVVDKFKLLGPKQQPQQAAA
jgi:single-strand DNA-binding protein